MAVTALGRASAVSAASTPGFPVSWERHLREPVGVTRLCGAGFPLTGQACLLGPLGGLPSSSPWEGGQR